LQNFLLRISMHLVMILKFYFPIQLRSEGLERRRRLYLFVDVGIQCHAISV
jgi:hypothetical protein